MTTLLGSALASAADWSWQPALEWRLDHQSNRLLSTTGAEASQAAWLSLDAVVRRATPVTDLNFHPRFELRRLTGDRPLDSKDASLELVGRWLQEYGELSASANIARQSTLTTELAETGIVAADTQRELGNVSAFWSWRLTRESSLSGALGYTDVSYPDAGRLGLVSYSYPNASFSFGGRLSIYTTWSLTALASRMEAPAVFTTSRNVALQAGLTRRLSPTTGLQLTAGLSETQRSDPFETRSDRSDLWKVGFSRTLESSQLNISLARSLMPNGRGVLARRDEASATLGHKLGPHLTGSLTLRATHNVERALGFSMNDEYLYRSAEAGLTRSLTPDWAMSLRVGGNDAHRRIADTDAAGWYSAFTLRWTPAARPVGLWNSP